MNDFGIEGRNMFITHTSPIRFLTECENAKSIIDGWLRTHHATRASVEVTRIQGKSGDHVFVGTQAYEFDHLRQTYSVCVLPTTICGEGPDWAVRDLCALIQSLIKEGDTCVFVSSNDDEDFFEVVRRNGTATMIVEDPFEGADLSVVESEERRLRRVGEGQLRQLIGEAVGASASKEAAKT